MAITRAGVTVAVSNLDGAVAFYTAFFEREPQVLTERFAGFDVDGSQFGLLSEEAYAVPLVRGNNVTPNLSVANIDAEFERIQALDPPRLSPVQSVGPIRLFMFDDPDGNVIELYGEPAAR